MKRYDDLKRRLAQGWNTWNTRSVLSHVLLPEAFALNLGLKEYAGRAYLKEALIGRRGEHDEQIHPGPHAYDGAYTGLNLKWREVEILIQSAQEGDDLVLLVTPLANQKKPALLVVESGILWNRPGYVSLEDGALGGHLPGRTVYAYGTKESVFEPYVAAQTPYLAMPLGSVVGVSTGKKRRVEEIQAIVDRRKAEQEERIRGFGDLADVYAAIQTCMSWDTVYEPEHERVVSPVSRIWNVGWGGFALFDWDTYFAAYMAALDNKDLAYANAIEITREKTERGFIPNFSTVSNVKSRDRSQPPVGAMVFRELYRRFGDRWVLKEVFDDLLEWNRWWMAHRNDGGLLCWGSDPYEPLVDAYFERAGVNERFGAALESGLDNSPMYDDMPFDPQTHLMQLADVGLNGLYIMDCEALADIATLLRRDAEAQELRQRAGAFREALATLWDEETGIFLNRRTDTGAFSHRLSPTHFYALLGRAATQAQAERMIAEHFYNPDEFWGDWIMPSIARSDPAYPDQDYWRGRIWGPMNFLVYLALRNYDLPQARADLVAKSKQLLLKEWLERGHVHENYCANTGEGCDKPNSDAFYHWGGLLGLIAFIEEGYLEGPETPISARG
jgi:putative isomerase